MGVRFFFRGGMGRLGGIIVEGTRGEKLGTGFDMWAGGMNK